MFSTALEQDLSVFSFAEMALFTNSVHIELILPQAVQLCIHFLLRKNKDGCTSLRDLIKDPPLVKESWKRQKEEKKPHLA